MTPLAHYLAKQLTLPAKSRDEPWGGIPPDEKATDIARLQTSHFFEMTAVVPLAEDAGAQLDGAGALEDAITAHSFLPAERTWIEYVAPETSDRYAFFLEADETGAARVTWYWRRGAETIGRISLGDGGGTFPSASYWTPKGERIIPRELKRFAQAHPEQVLPLYLGRLHLLLLILNSPKIIDRTEHAPHKGLARQLARSGMTAKGYTEIHLQVRKPADIDDGQPHASVIGGQRALHFCRKHLRVRLGKLEYVRGHWRGDPTTGIKRSHYVVRA